MTVAPAPTASTWSEAVKLSEAVTLDEAIRRLKADNNPKIYRYRKAARIAMNLIVHEHGLRWAFVGFEYCNRNGYGETGVADFRNFTMGRGWTPTVFQSDRFGYFHVREKI